MQLITQAVVDIGRTALAFFQPRGSTFGDATNALSKFDLANVSVWMRPIFSWQSGLQTTAMGEYRIIGSLCYESRG